MKKPLYAVFAAVALAVFLTGFIASGFLHSPDQYVSDRLYQSPSYSDGEIIVVGIDQRALDELGPMPWPRAYMAEAISVLNADTENAPAVIGVDVLYAGGSADPEGDLALAQAAKQGGNVVVAGAAQFGNTLVADESSFYIDTQAVLAWDSPYEELAASASVGHINTMADADGLIRHSLLYADLPTGERISSFSRVIYEKYAAYWGEEPNSPPAGPFFYLPFTSAPGGYYEEISVIDLLNREIDPSYFAGKIVLIGPYAAGLQDEYRTAIDYAVPMYGIEIQANMIDAFRTGFFPEEVSNALQYLLLFIISFAAFFFLHMRSLRVNFVFWLLLSGGWIGLCVLLYRSASILHPLWIPFASTLILILNIILHYLTAAKEKRRITSTFGRYVDPAILKELLVSGSEANDLGGKNFEIAVLFVDIRGFTTMSESLPPATVVEILNRYLTLTTNCIMRHHGTLDKFVGDCTMAFWNAPLPQEDFVYEACRAAMDMVDGSKALGEELQKQFGRTVSFGVGVHVGPAVVGNIGAPQRMDYTAIGDTVNTASRLESNAPGGKILISRAVADRLGNRAEVTSLGSSIKLKGKAEGFECLTLDRLY